MSSMSEYLALKAVSAGVLRTLIDECPYAAWYGSPFNPTPPPADDSDASDAGTIIHSILLEGSTDCVEVVDPQNHPAEKTGAIPAGWTNKSIRLARDNARAAGKIPVLKGDFANIAAAVASAQRFIESLKASEPAIWAAFQPGGGRSEETITWDWDGVPCKIRPDRIANDSALIIDLKTTKTSAAPESWGRSQLLGGSLYLSTPFYAQGIEAGTGIRPVYVYLVVSQTEPYLCSLVSCDAAMLGLGERKIAWAMREWKKCAASGRFPGYAPRVHYVELPPWEQVRWEEKEVMNLELGSQG